MTAGVYVSGMGCLTAYGRGLDALVDGLGHGPALSTVLPQGRRPRPVFCGRVPEFKEALAHYAPPLARRKMSRLSKMAVTAAGDALVASGLSSQDNSGCGVVLGTAFGSTAQSELFYSNLLAQGALKVNPGYFPETVPNAAAGQVSIVFGLQGANTTVCQQALSSEHALALAFDLLAGGMAQRLVVLGVEEMGPALLGGLQSCGLLFSSGQSDPDSVVLTKHSRPGEACVALVLETAESLAGRRGQALARLHDVATAGAAVWPAVYHGVGPALEGLLDRFPQAARESVGAVIAGATWLKEVDRCHLQTLADLLDPGCPVVLPEYGSGNVMGAGLMRTALAVALVGGHILPCRLLGAELPSAQPYGALYDGQVGAVDHVLASVVSPGGGAGAVLVGRA